MGSCLSNHNVSSVSASPPTAKVISSEGHLREYPVPISVSRVLQTEDHSASDSSSFLCSSDRLYYDEFIPPLPLDHFLQSNQIYFLLPSTNLHRRLAASDMAALAVKASRALQLDRPKKGGRVSPMILLPNEDDQHQHNAKNSPADTSTSYSVKKLQRLTSRRAKMAVRSFKLKLSTIYEGTVM